ncbi:MAG: GspH/FimT family pseudopilin [Pseudoxanthomonas sp.]
MSRRHVSGFTLVELMVVIAIAAILLTVALPSFQAVLRSNRLATTSNELLTSLSLARSEGIRSTRGGGVCASASGTACDGNWNNGWLVWTETDGNGAFDAGETVVRYSQGKAQLLLSAVANTVAFDARGRAIGGGTDIQLTPAGVSTPVRCVSVGVTGQTRILQRACP